MFRALASMANCGRNTSGRHFVVNFRKASYLDCKQVLFGRGVEGMDAVQKMATVATDKERPALCDVRYYYLRLQVGMVVSYFYITRARKSESKKESLAWRKKLSKHRRDKVGMMMIVAAMTMIYHDAGEGGSPIIVTKIIS